MGGRGGRRGKRRRGAPAKKFSSVERAQAGVSSIIYGEGGIPSPFTLDSYFEGLRRSIWLMASTYRLAFAIASIDFQVLKRKDRTEARGRKANQIRDLFDRVNEEDTYFDHLEQQMIHLAVAGETFTEIADNRLGEPAELHEWNPDAVFPIPDPTGRRRVAAYRFRLGDGNFVELPREKVIHTKVYNPFSRHRGFSFVSPMTTDLGADVQAALWNRAFLRNGARSGGWLKPQQGDLDDGQWRRLVSEVQRTTSGSDNAGKYGVLPTGIEITETGTNPKDLDWTNLRRWVREVAAGATGIPPILVGNFDAASYANTEQQLRAFWDYVGKPWLLKVFAAKNEQLVHRRIDPELIIWPDMRAIDSLIDSETTRVANTVSLVSNSIMTINEGRRAQGLEPLPDGDRLLLPLNLDPMDPSSLEREEPEPPPAAPPPEEGEEPEEEPEGEDGERFVGELVAKVSEAGREAMREVHARDVRRAQGKIEIAARAFLRRFRAGFVDRARAAGEVPDPDTIAGPAEAESRAAFEALAPVVLGVIQDGADATMRRMGMEKGAEVYRRKADAPERLPELLDVLGAFDELNPRVLAHLELVFGHLEDLTRETVSEIREVVAKGVGEGLGINEIVPLLEELSSLDAKRAERIARTEAASAQGLGANEAFRAAGTVRKSWLSAKIEGRTRDSHRAADAKYSRAPIPIDEKFVLEDPSRSPSRVELRFPSDPEAPAWAVVNCLCSMVPEQAEAKAYFADSCLEEVSEPCPC